MPKHPLRYDDEGNRLPPQHSWQHVTTMTRENGNRSPRSTWDDHLWEDVIEVQSCACGATRQLVLGFKNRRRRGDDLRAQAGNSPLGTPLQRSGTYAKPRVIVSA